MEMTSQERKEILEGLEKFRDKEITLEELEEIQELPYIETENNGLSGNNPYPMHLWISVDFENERYDFYLDNEE